MAGSSRVRQHSALRVAIDCRLMYYRKAGIAQYTRHLVQALRHEPSSGSVELSVILDRRDADLAWLPAGVRVHRVITPAHHRLESLTLPLELAFRRIDVLHSPDFIAPRGRFRKVITIHDLYFMEHSEVMSAAGIRYYSRTRESACRADRVIAVSEYTRSEIMRLLPSVPVQKVRVIYEGADNPAPDGLDRSHAGADDTSISTPSPSGNGPYTEVIAPIVSRPSSFADLKSKIRNSPYALFVGTFEPRKNLSTLLRALKELPGTLSLVIVGEPGWRNQSLQEQARDLGVSDRIIFAGRLSDADLGEAYEAARMLVFPSLSEGFGLPVLEAMAHGTPVVCSNAGALPEITGDAALLHDPTDVAALARCMRIVLIFDSVHNDYARRGRERVQAFTWQRAAQQTWEVYQACASSS